MQKELQKRPYLAPEIISVEFSVEKGMTGSLEPEPEYNGNGLKGFESELDMMMFISSQNNSGARMGGPMNYFGSGAFGAPSSSSPAPMGGGYGDGGYFGGGF